MPAPLPIRSALESACHKAAKRFAEGQFVTCEQFHQFIMESCDVDVWILLRVVRIRLTDRESAHGLKVKIVCDNFGRPITCSFYMIRPATKHSDQRRVLSELKIEQAEKDYRQR